MNLLLKLEYKGQRQLAAHVIFLGSTTAVEAKNAGAVISNVCFILYYFLLGYKILIYGPQEFQNALDKSVNNRIIPINPYCLSSLYPFSNKG